jgi:EAL domain-containing protein (putative c-di-GMP-specific phosphodiesterase class I)
MSQAIHLRTEFSDTSGRAPESARGAGPHGDGGGQPERESRVRLARSSYLDARLSDALASLHMHFQPIVDVTTRRAAGYEALLRSREPALPNPGAVLEAAERLGRLPELGRRVRAAVAEAAPRAPEGALLFVNLHAADLFDEALYDAAEPLSGHAARVVLELTERASAHGVTDLSERIARLRAMGYRLAIDDLGAGYAGLSYFVSLAPDVVKIDMSLTRGLDASALKRRVVASLARLGAELGMVVVAEGVETSGERDVLVEIGCGMLQGYALGRPGPDFAEPRWP